MPAGSLALAGAVQAVQLLFCCLPICYRYCQPNICKKFKPNYDCWSRRYVA